MTIAALTPAEVAATRLDELVPHLVETRRQLARLQAHEARLLAQAGSIAHEWAQCTTSVSDADFAHRSTAAEIAAAWHVSDRTIQRQMATATLLVTNFPATLASLEAGRISRGHVSVILDAGERITRSELRAEYERAVLAYAEVESASRLAPVAKRRAEWFLDETIAERHAHSRAQRCVIVVDLDDGMAEVRATMDAALAHGVHDRLSRMARDVADAEKSARRDPGERAPRSIDELRTDIFADLLLASDPTAHIGTSATGLGAIRATVQVTVPVLTLLDDTLTDPFEAVMLGGFGPIDADTARHLAATASGWDRVLTHPITGAVLSVDRYQPTKKMRRHLQVRDQHCRFPGCRVSARRADADHTIDYQYGGATACGNLAHLCRRHHSLKHHTAWTVTQHPGGVLEWTSPTGRHYSDHPSSGVAFCVDAAFDPAFDPALDPAPF